MNNKKDQNVKNLAGKRGFSFALLIVIGLIQAVLTVLFALSVKNLTCSVCEDNVPVDI